CRRRRGERSRGGAGSQRERRPLPCHLRAGRRRVERTSFAATSPARLRGCGLSRAADCGFEAGSRWGTRRVRDVSLPTGTVTFLFTDIEGSTRLMQELGDEYVQAQLTHHEILRAAFRCGNGRELRTEGDSFFCVFQCTLAHLGLHRLKDLPRPGGLDQLVIDGAPITFPALRTLDSTPNNLPTQLTIFVGREPEVTEGKRLLHGTRLLTLTGPGGMGKT